ncbi:MAG TPA: UDP-N-acetylmuramate dehydrogenase [Kofleriaceae bacterium]
MKLAELTTLGVGGEAREFLRAETDAQLVAALAQPRVLLVGGGSNLVVGDAGWDGLVVQIATKGIRREGDVWIAKAGEVWDDFVAATIAAGDAGLECLSGIPGLVGATPMQNVGAYGQEVADTIEWVSGWDRGAPFRAAPSECAFAYRTSKFKGTDRWVIGEVAFRLRRDPPPIRYAELAKAIGGTTAPAAQIRETVIRLRRGKGMVVDPGDPDSRSAGSFFTNPIVSAEEAARLARLHPSMPAFPAGERVKLAAAWLIERSGFPKGTVRGRVGTSTKHSLAIINRGGATAAEILALADEIRAGVRAEFGIELEAEPVIV